MADTSIDSVTMNKSARVLADAAVKKDSPGGSEITAGEAKAILASTANAKERRAVAATLLTCDEFGSKINEDVAKLLIGEFNAKAESTDKSDSVKAHAVREASNDPQARQLAKADKLLDDPNVRLALMNPDSLRGKDHQKFVDGIRNTELYRTYHKDVRRSLTDQVSNIIADSELTGTLVDKTNVDGVHLHQFTPKLYELIQETARMAGVIGYEGGPDEVELKVLSGVSPNAYVYGFWNEKPRVHVIDAIVDVFYDDEKDDWVSEEAKLMLQSVIAHELWHIKDNPAEWGTWFGILTEASGLLEGHEDGPLFSADEKASLISDAKSYLSAAEEYRASEGKMKYDLRSAGLLDFVADSKLNKAAKDAVEKFDISKEEATAALVEMLGVDVDSARYKGIERNADGTPTRFGLAQMVFQDSYQLTRAGEIAADRGAFLVQGTNKWTALMDRMLATVPNFNQFCDSAAEKRAFNDRLLKVGYKEWVEKQTKSTDDHARTFNIPAELKKLACVSHPPGAARIVEGMEYMSRFINPDAYPHLVAELQAMDKPVEKAMELIRVMERAMHDEITRYVDPRGFDKADATARVMHGFRYTRDREDWTKAIGSGLKVLDELISDADLTNAKSKAYKQLEAGLSGSKVISANSSVPMEQVTEHIIRRLEGLKAGASGEALKTLDKRIEAMWKEHKSQLKKQQAVFKEPKKSVEAKLKAILKELDDGPKDTGSDDGSKAA